MAFFFQPQTFPTDFFLIFTSRALMVATIVLAQHMTAMAQHLTVVLAIVAQHMVVDLI